MIEQNNPAHRIHERLLDVLKEEYAKDGNTPALVVGLAVTMASLVKNGYVTEEEIKRALDIALMVPSID